VYHCTVPAQKRQHKHLYNKLAASHNPNDTGHKTVKAATEISYVLRIMRSYSVTRRLQRESTAAAIKS